MAKSPLNVAYLISIVPRSASKKYAGPVNVAQRKTASASLVNVAPQKLVSLSSNVALPKDASPTNVACSKTALSVNIALAKTALSSNVRP